MCRTLRERLLERRSTFGQHGLAVRDDDELDRQCSELFAQLRPQLVARPVLFGFREPPDRELEAAVFSDQEIATSARCGSRKNIASDQSAPLTTIGWTPTGSSIFSSGRHRTAL